MAHDHSHQHGPGCNHDHSHDHGHGPGTVDRGDPRDKLPGIRHVIAIASGKGGVGKSTVSANLALALARMGKRVGLIDCDILGPSIPTMMGIPKGTAPSTLGDRLVPMERHGVKLVSMGMLTGDDSPAILRGPMVSRYLQMFVQGVVWDKLDHLILDLPPGTGDVQLTLAQGTPLSGAIIVTTPQDVSLNIARRGLRMFERVQVPILGVVENMSGFSCPHCAKVTDIFRKGGGEAMAKSLGVPFLGAIPLDPAVVEGGDTGTPVVAAHPDSAVAGAYRKLAEGLATALEGAATASVGAFQFEWTSGEPTPPWLPAAVRRDGTRHVPVGFRKRDPRALTVLWQDGVRHDYDVRDLRLACPCAACVEETTGRKLLDPASVRADIAPLSVHTVGTYAILFRWNDGHETGIYSFDFLRAMGDRAAGGGFDV